MSFAIENILADGLVRVAGDDDWAPVEYPGGRTLLDEERRETSHDPVEVCEKMIELLTQLLAHFKQVNET